MDPNLFRLLSVALGAAIIVAGALLVKDNPTAGATLFTLGGGLASSQLFKRAGDVKAGGPDAS